MDGLYLGQESLKYLWSKMKETFSKPAGENVIYTDTESGVKYKLCVTNGRIVLVEE